MTVDQSNWRRQGTESVAAWIASLPQAAREKKLRTLAPTPEDLSALEFAWEFWGRPNQFAPPGAWSAWLILAGRGWGKTRTGAEWIRDRVARGVARRIAVIGRTAADARDVMVEGESGILAVSPPWDRPKYEASKRRLTWKNGAVATVFSADEPDLLRGPQHDTGWADELAAWRYADAWDQFQFGLRLGASPQAVVTTTPRPTKLIRELAKDPSTRVTRGTTFENRGNLAARFLNRVVAKYQGTRLGRQELEGLLLDDSPGALWKRAWFDDLRVRALPDLVRVVVAIDPAVADPALARQNQTAETGIVVCGLDRRGEGYVIDDLSGHYSPDEWARLAVGAYKDRKADRIIGEVNNGGALVEFTVRTVDPNVSFKAVHASRGKAIRAEPVSALYEQKRIHHLGLLPELEDQMATWDAAGGGKSPDRLDAAVWGLTELIVDSNVIPVRKATGRSAYRTGSDRGF